MPSKFPPIIETIYVEKWYTETNDPNRKPMGKLSMQNGKKDFFISYNCADKKMAEWIAWVIEAAGYTTIIQAWDFLSGVSFPVAMQKASVECDRTIAVLSKASFEAKYTQPEWAAAFKQDPSGEKGVLLPVRAEDFDPKGIFGTMAYIDLVGLEEADAEKLLLKEIDFRTKGKRRKPESRPSFDRIEKKAFRPRPQFEPIPVVFKRLVLGEIEELVGRKEALAWLEKQLFDGKDSRFAQASLQGAGGMGKTFLAHAFADKNRQRTSFYPIYLGETKPFDAGIVFLGSEGVDTSAIDDEAKLKAVSYSSMMFVPTMPNCLCLR
jgi:hypothetical protein